jgi:hypothetical protein
VDGAGRQSSSPRWLTLAIWASLVVVLGFAVCAVLVDRAFAWAACAVLLVTGIGFLLRAAIRSSGGTIHL